MLKRIRHLLPVAIVAYTIAATLIGCASPNTATANARSSTKQAPAASVDLLLVEALRQFVERRDAPQARAMTELATKRAPDRIDALWLHLQMCLGTPGCQPEALEARLRKLDKSNSAVWLGPLARAIEHSDRASEDQILETIGRSERVDLYWNGMVAKLATALAERTRTNNPENKTPLTDAVNEVVGLLSKIAVPAFQPLADSCGVRRLTDRLAATRCLLVAATLQRSDTYIADSVGLGIAQRVAATGSGDSAKIEQRIALSRYQRDSAGQLITGQLERERFSTELLEVMRTQRREQDVFIAVIRWAGEPLTPQ
jgi:hypothetical protein